MPGGMDMRTKLKAIRQAKGWKSQGEIAGFFHVGQSTVSRWLAGEDIPKGQHWEDINSTYKELFLPSIILPDRVIEKFNQLSPSQQILAIALFEAALDTLDKAEQ